jgi:hypothetical protein
MLAYTYTNIEDALEAVKQVNFYWNFIWDKKSTLHFNESSILTNLDESYYYIPFSEWTFILGEPTLINITIEQ